MKNLFFLLSVLVLLCGCKRKKPSLSGDEPVQVEDFIASFSLAKPPYEVSDSNLLKKDMDSLLISYPVFTQFVPDTILALYFGKNAKPKIYPLKRVEGDNQETYLFVKSVLGVKRIAYILVFDRKQKF